MKVKAGSLLILSNGEYSDYTFGGPFTVTKDFDQQEVSDSYRKDFVPDYEGDDPDESGFIAWMARNGFIENLDCLGWHIGSYGFDPTIHEAA